MDALGPEHSDVITTGGAIVVALISAVGFVLAALVQSGRKASKRAESAAQTAVEQTSGNEADHTHVAELLEQVQAAVIRQERKAEQHQAESSAFRREVRRDIGGIREEMRTERSERHQLAEFVVKRLNTEEKS